MLTPSIALLGNPNSGKTTLFNDLTGGKKPVGNWSGVTVTQQTGLATFDNISFEVIDLPGTYSLTVVEDDAVHDESIPAAFLKSHPVSWVVNVVDAMTIERNLYLTLQALEQNLPVVVVINRLNVLKKQGKTLSLEKLQAALGCPVISTDTLKVQHKLGSGSLFVDKTQSTPCLFSDGHVSAESSPKKWAYPAIIEQQLAGMVEQGHPRWKILRWLEGEKPADPALAQAIATAQWTIETAVGQPADVIIATHRYAFIEHCLRESMTDDRHAIQSSSLDAVLCHRFWGLPCFFAIMYAMFFFAIGIGGALQGIFEWLATFVCSDLLSQGLTLLAAPAWLHVLLVSGLGQAVITLVTFIPVIGAMFLALSFLEESGYMARAAFVMDRLMRAVGLPGKSFVPMIIGFGCNVPAILGTRTLDNRRDRILAVMMSPFMSCGARLAIFTVFVAAFFPRGGQNIVFLLYMIGIAMAVLTGLLLKKTLLRGNNAPFLLDMPRYQWPPLRTLQRASMHRLSRFLINAGKLIIPVCMVIGLLNQITPQGRWVDANDASQSVLSAVGKQMVVVFKPMGIEEDNWPAAVGLLTGLMAKEVVIGTLNALYVTPVATGQAIEQAPEQAYGEMVKRFHGQSNAFAYLLFVLLYFPCMSATAAMLREVQKGWTLFSVSWTTGLAYGIAVGYYQCATFIDHPVQSLLWLSVLGLTGIGTWVGIRYYSRTYLWHKVPTRIVIA